MQLPPFERTWFTLRLTAPARFHFLHGGVLRGLLSAALEQHELPVGVVPFAPESGRARFDTGQAYRFGLTLAGPESASAERILTGLERVGRDKPKASAPPPTLGGNFRLEAAVPLATADPGAEADALRELGGPGGRLTLRFLSPLRLERPEGSRSAAPRSSTRSASRPRTSSSGSGPASSVSPAAGFPPRRIAASCRRCRRR